MVQDKLRNRPEMAQDRHRMGQDKPKSRNVDLQGDPERDSRTHLVSFQVWCLRKDVFPYVLLT